MSSLCQQVLAHFASQIGAADLSNRPWHLITGKAGPNAALKVIIPPRGRYGGYVLTVARHRDTPVVKHEADTLIRLCSVLPERIRSPVPELLACGDCDGTMYFAVPFYQPHGQHRPCHRLYRRRRFAWVHNWLTALARHTRQPGVSCHWIDTRYAEPLAAVQSDERVHLKVKRRLDTHFSLARRCAADIPAVCCHGDFDAYNIIWDRFSRAAVVLDWGAAAWPGLPCVDLCRFALSNVFSDAMLGECMKSYCRAVDMDPTLVPAIYDLYRLTVKADLDLAYVTQPHLKYEPFLPANDTFASRLMQIGQRPVA